MADVTIKISQNGPILVMQEVEVIDAGSGKPIRIDKFPIALCRCGQSTNKPFCDGSHNRCDFDGALADGNVSD
jgi:CDGSH-type Zn-finger protein